MRSDHMLCVLLALLLLGWIPVAAGVDAVDWGAVQWPFSTTTTVGVPTETIYGRVYEAGVTEGVGQGPGIYAELGYGADGTDPATDPSWTWVPAAYEGDLWLPDNTNDDQYAAQIVPTAPGTYDYAYRFSRDGALWLYCDMRGSGPDTGPGGGSADGYSSQDAGHLVVERALCPKWVQEPDCDYGVDLPSYAIDGPQGGGFVPMYVVGDDWWCDGRPIDAIRWWGSYPGWDELVPPFGPNSGRPLSFRLSWYTDIPAGDPRTDGFSRPGHLLTNVIVSLLPFEQHPEGPGQVSELYYCSVDKEVPPYVEHEYEYYVELAEPWNEKRGRIYWLTIEALYPSGYEPGAPVPEPPFPGATFPEWGWKTSIEHDIIDDAVVWPQVEVGSPPGWYEMIWPHYPWLPGLFYPPASTFQFYGFLVQPENTGPSVNMAFELLTDICPRRTEKWSQMPDMVNGTDIWSWRWEHDQPSPALLLADDFISDGRLISDIHWWGSYSNWMTWVNGSETNPVPPPPTNFFLRPLGFNLSWHTNNPAGCWPGEEYTNLFVAIEDCHEMYYGTVTQYWREPPNFEHEYQYYVDLLAVAEPWPEMEHGHYWLNIEAVFDGGFVPIPEQGFHGGWGWKIALDPTEETCMAAESDRQGGWRMAVLPHDYIPEKVGQPFNLAFELTTHEVSTNSPTLPIVITNTVSESSNTVHIVESVGTSGAGVQYLQMNTNLLTNVWTDVMGQVKLVPFPPPIVNTWTVTGVTDSNVFYRVLEK